MSGKRVYGIDLGTTYSCIAHVDEHGKPVVLPNSEGDLTTPSVVFFETPENIVVGQAAKEVVAIHADRCVSTVKRAMGDPDWRQEFFGQTYRPQDISSFILRKVVRDAEQITGEKIEDVVITCPAYFGVAQKEATRQAGQLAGLNVLYVIPEPTAAALAYGIDQTQDQVVLVYDLGGGTFDVTVIDIKAREVTVVCTGGDHDLGGKNWDDAIVTHFAERFSAETGSPADPLINDHEAYQELLIAAERCKKRLSTSQAVTEAVRFGGDRVKVELTRETFDRITDQYLQNTLTLTEAELAKAREKGYARVDKVLLVGGSTYMPQIMEAVKKQFGDFEIRQFDPNQAVAKGAALFGFKCYLDDEIRKWVAEKTGQRQEQVDLGRTDAGVVAEGEKHVAQEHGYSLPGMKALLGKEITNVTSKSFGIVVVDPKDRHDVVANLIEMNATVPRTATQKFGVEEDGQIQADLRCIENTARGLAQIELSDWGCNEVGKAVLEFGKPLSAGSPVEVTFSLAADGLLSLKARDLTTGREVEATLKTEAIMSAEDVKASTKRNLSLNVT